MGWDGGGFFWVNAFAELGNDCGLAVLRGEDKVGPIVLFPLDRKAYRKATLTANLGAQLEAYEKLVS